MPSERFNVSGKDLIGRLQDLIREGNIRRVRLIQGDNVLVDIPLSIGAPAAAAVVLATPVLAAVGAIAALVTNCTIEVEKEGGPEQPAPPEQPTQPVPPEPSDAREGDLGL